MRKKCIGSICVACLSPIKQYLEAQVWKLRTKTNLMHAMTVTSQHTFKNPLIKKNGGQERDRKAWMRSKTQDSVFFSFLICIMCPLFLKLMFLLLKLNKWPLKKTDIFSAAPLCAAGS